MIRRRIGDTFEYRKDHFVYTLQCVERTGTGCDGCFFQDLKPCHHIVGECDSKYLGGDKGYALPMAFTCIHKKDLNDEITKSNVEELTKAIKSIGESFKIVELFKQLAEKAKNEETNTR